MYTYKSVWIIGVLILGASISILGMGGAFTDITTVETEEIHTTDETVYLLSEFNEPTQEIITESIETEKAVHTDERVLENNGQKHTLNIMEMNTKFVLR